MAARKLDVFPFGNTQKILIVGDNTITTKIVLNDLLDAGFSDAKIASRKEASVAEIDGSKPDLILIDVHLRGEVDSGVALLSALREDGFNGLIAVTTHDPSAEEFLEVVRAGANDYLVRGPKLNIVGEVVELLEQTRWADRSSWHPDVIAKLGFFRTLGLTKREIEILVEYARDFPRQRELAQRLGKAEAQLRKSFSQIYQKLSAPLAVDNSAQLASLLTICSMCH